MNGLHEKFESTNLGEGQKKYAPSRVEKEVSAQNCFCGKETESRTHVVRTCELHEKERGVLEGGNMTSKQKCHGTVWNGQQ